MDFETRIELSKDHLKKVFTIAEHWTDRCESFEPGSYMKEQSQFLLLALLEENKTWLASVRDLRIERVFSNDDQPAVTTLLPVEVEISDPMFRDSDAIAFIRKGLVAQFNELNSYLDLLTYGTQNYRVILTLSECNELEVLQFIQLFAGRMETSLRKLDALVESFSLSATTQM